MKGILYVLVVLFIAAMLLGFVKMDFEAKLFSQENLYQWLTIGASVCGLLLAFIFIRYLALKDNLRKD